MDEPLEREVKIVNRRGLHARASAKFVKTAARFSAKVEVEKDGITVLGTSIMGLMLLAAAPGEDILIRTRGKDREAAMEALVALVEARFDEE